MRRTLLHSFLPLACLLMLSACQQRPPPAAAERADLAVTEWSLPPIATAAQPDLVKASDGRLLLSWIETDDSGVHALKFATYGDDAWSAPSEIARGDDWFVNWADTPHVLATEDGALWAHWLRQSAGATYAYDVVLTRSSDGGKTWAPAVAVNSYGTPTEHGFVSLWPQSRDTLGIAWLDGRNMAGDGHASHDTHAAGTMTLRVARFDARLAKSAETELDPRTCDCCQTAAAVGDRGVLLAYRDRDGDEIRDIVTTRFDQGAWTLPRKVHDDRWKMPACPVNGPAVAARGHQAWVAWYTAAGETPQVRVAHSADAGDQFRVPVNVDAGVAVQGRVGIEVDADEVWVHWTREEADGQSLWLARYDEKLGNALQRTRIARLQGRGRATGFPQMVVRQGVGYVVWTDVVSGKPVLRGARLVAKGNSQRAVTTARN